MEAIHQNVVKHPVLPDAASRARLSEHKSAIFNERYADYLELGVEEWRKSYAEHEALGKKAVLFVMVDDTKNCDEVGEHLQRICSELRDAVLVIHTKNNGEISEAASSKNKEQLNKLREASNKIDSWESPHKAIVSVLVLKEGWDVRNVKHFMREHLFEPSPVNLEDPVVLRNLSEPEVGKILFNSFKAAINALTVRETGSSRIEDRIRLRDTRPFRTDHRPYLAPKKSLFSKIVGEPRAGGFELAFARFLDDAPDVVAFAKNYLAVGFKLDYVKADCDLSNYIPDFLVMTTDGAIWIVETKGQQELELPRKMARLRQWCADATAASVAEGGQVYRFLYVDQKSYERDPPQTMAALVAGLKEYQS